jgi:hypothetical protein
LIVIVNRARTLDIPLMEVFAGRTDGHGQNQRATSVITTIDPAGQRPAGSINAKPWPKTSKQLGAWRR